MRVPIRILVADLTLPDDTITWGDIIDNWEAYAVEWNASNQLNVFQSEAPVLDMFGDESISIKQMVKDMSDPKKLFTEYSRSFTVPASKKNNAIFQHYYNIEIVGGLDSRELIPCRILMGNTTYKIGNLSIEGVQMSDGAPRSYKIRFVGKLSELARRIGSDELTAIGLSQYNIDNFDPKAEFSTPAANDIVFPLASRSKRFLVHSGDADYTQTFNIDNAKNIRYVSSNVFEGYYGLGERDIVGAMKVGTILDKIEETYGINFQGVLTRDYVRFLYLWLHKATKERDADEYYSASVTNLSPQTPPANAGGDIVVSANSVNFTAQPNGFNYMIQARGTWTGGGRVELLKNGQVVATETVSGDKTQPVWVSTDNINSNQGIGEFTAKLYTSTTQTASVDIIVTEFEYTIPQGEIRPENVELGVYTYSDATLAIGTLFTYTISEHIPQMKVMDFLSSLFKMFNLIAEVDEDLNVQTRHHDAYMSEGVVRDVTQYVDQSKYNVNRPNLYSSIRFKFEDAKTALEQGYLAVNARNYGELSYQLTSASGAKLSGSEYVCDIPNQRIPVERLINIETKSLTRIAYCLFADLKGAEQDHKPAFTYIASKTGTTGLAWTDGLTTTEVTNYVQPTSLFNDNTEPTSVLDGYVGLFFGEETNEQQLDKLIVGFGLFNNFYKGLTASLFDENTRRVTFKAQLPARVLLTLKMSDTLLISGKFYMINSIETDYLSGDSKLELTLVGRSKLSYYQKKSFNVTNNSAGDLRVTYVNWNGFIAATTISPSATTQIDCVGSISTFSNQFYTLVEL